VLSLWFCVSLILSLPRLVYRLLHKGKPFSELPRHYHSICRLLDSLLAWGFFALLVLSGFQAKWKAAIFWVALYLLLTWIVDTYTAKRAANTAFRSIKVAFPQMTEETFDPNALLRVEGKRGIEKVL
jgi:hypothetical protein